MDLDRRLDQDEKWRRGYIPLHTTYLNGERWEDELGSPMRALEDGSEEFLQDAISDQSIIEGEVDARD